jgi:hypothetical protein
MEINGVNFENREFPFARVQLANTGSEDYEGTVTVEASSTDGETYTQTLNNVVAGGSYNVNFQTISSRSELQKVTVIPEECPDQRIERTDF